MDMAVYADGGGKRSRVRNVIVIAASVGKEAESILASEEMNGDEHGVGGEFGCCGDVCERRSCFAFGVVTNKLQGHVLAQS